jgi:hypothetical protein
MRDLHCQVLLISLNEKKNKYLITVNTAFDRKT